MFTNAQANYGPQGATRLLATYASLMPGQALGVAGILTLIASGGRGGYLETTSNALVMSAMVVMTPGVVRVYEGVRLGRAFRAGRPFQK